MTDMQMYVIAGFLGFISIILLVVAYRLRPGYTYFIGLNLISEFRKAFSELETATRAHVQVNAVLALLDEFQNRPEVIENLAEYSRQSVAAAITQQINSTASDIATVSEKLSTHRENLAGCKHEIDRSNYQKQVNYAESMLDRLQRKLEVLYSLSQNFDLLRSNND